MQVTATWKGEVKQDKKGASYWRVKIGDKYFNSYINLEIGKPTEVSVSGDFIRAPKGMDLLPKQPATNEVLETLKRIEEKIDDQRAFLLHQEGKRQSGFTDPYKPL